MVNPLLFCWCDKILTSDLRTLRMEVLTLTQSLSGPVSSLWEELMVVVRQPVTLGSLPSQEREEDRH